MPKARPTPAQALSVGATVHFAGGENAQIIRETAIKGIIMLCYPIKTGIGNKHLRDLYAVGVLVIFQDTRQYPG